MSTSRELGLPGTTSTDPAMETAITVAYDAFRICMGQQPKRWKRADVLRWMGCIDAATARGHECAESPDTICDLAEALAALEARR